MNKFLCFALLLLSHAYPGHAHAGIGDELGLSPFWDWKEIKTEHFRVVFPAEISKQAEKVARLYEEAHIDLRFDLRWEPSTRVNVLVVDNSDAANGMTTPISRFGMLLYLTPPDAFFSTDYYDDWLRILVYHEYTHFLNMDPTRGLYSAFRLLFGDVLLPNSLWPSWMLEGYAVYNETKYTRSGRGRSPYWEGLLRTAVEADALNRSDWITLDRVAGSHPRFPSGEIAYLFGYHLMNAAESGQPGTLSEMTDRSSSRVPFFINGNLENITGKDWYAHWDAWVARTNSKMKAQLETIKSQPVSSTEILEGTRDEAFGIAFSPDLRWAAYSSETEGEWQQLKLREWKPGAEARSVEDKFFGASIVFTPDSKRMIYSSLHKKKNYYFFSDLRAYDLTTGKAYWITDGARAKDPDLSKDGKKITFTESSDSGTDLMLGELVFRDGRLTIESKRKLIDAAPGDRIANPKFTPDQKGIIFSKKVEGNLKESIELYSFEKDAVSSLMSDEFRNRFPTLDTKGTLYFVSDKSGVDNLYRHESGGKATLITNVTGALWLPAFRGPDLYASVLSKDGFSIAKVQTFTNGINPEKVRVKTGEEAPKAHEKNGANYDSASTQPYIVEDYSALSTLLPRQWAPLLISDSISTYVGGQVFGYDNTFRHQYFLFGAHDSTARTMDYSVQYDNRSFGPTLSLSAAKLTEDVLTTSYTRNDRLGAELSFPFQGTTSRFTPSIAYRAERDSYYDLIGGTRSLIRQTRLIPEQDLLLEYQNTRSSRAAVTQERGNLTSIGLRRYDLEGGRDLYKGIFKHAQYFHLGGHAVLIPTLKAMKVNRRDSSFLDASALSRGKRGRLLNPSYTDDFDEFGIRGYPLVTFTSREAITLSTDLKFPIAAIFRGWGTNPLFFEQLSMQLFAEDTYRPSASSKFQHLPSAGAGLRLGVNALLYIPFTLGADYHYGFNKDAFGQGEFFISITAASTLPF